MTPDKLRDCDACGGTGKPASGLPCMCGGTGRAVDAVDYLRKAHFAALEEIERLKVHAEAMAAAIERSMGYVNAAKAYRADKGE